MVVLVSAYRKETREDKRMLARFNINRNKKQLMVVKRGKQPNLREIEEGEKKRDSC